MEDQTQKTDPGQEEIPAIKKKKPINPKCLTVTIIRSVGKTYSFNISSRTVVGASIFFFAYIVVSLFTINGYIDLRSQYKIKSEKFNNLENELDKNRKMLIQSEQRVALLEDYIEGFQEQMEQGSESEQDIKKSTETGDRSAEDDHEGNENDEKSVKSVDIEDFIIQKDESRISVDFKLVNKSNEEGAMEGYIHIIAMDKDMDFPTEWNYRKDELQNGLPLNFRRGLPFLIQRFKSYNRNYNVISNSELPLGIRILVYDRSGNLLLKREFEVDSYG